MAKFFNKFKKKPIYIHFGHIYIVFQKKEKLMWFSYIELKVTKTNDPIPRKYRRVKRWTDPFYRNLPASIRKPKITSELE